LLVGVLPVPPASATLALGRLRRVQVCLRGRCLVRVRNSNSPSSLALAWVLAVPSVLQ
jgi:hypothetical protein